jgi:choline dehydrogenase-like flavoprotein
MDIDFDAIIVGSGAGGGMAAYALAKAGKRILLIERGRKFTDSDYFLDEQRMMIEMAAFDDRQMLVNGNAGRMYIGGVLGGGTALYGGVLMRPSREDFMPGKYYSHKIPREIWEWPVSYEDLLPYFDRAEKLMGVMGDCTVKIKNIETPLTGYEKPTPELESINKRFERTLTDIGYSPYHLPFGIDFTSCLRCPTCPGYYCPNSARASTLERLIKRAQKSFGLEVRSYSECERLVTGDGRQVMGLEVLDRESGNREKLTAERYILSAGAIGSPVLLLKSQVRDSSDQMGRNFMYHAGALVAGIFLRATGGNERFVKQLGFTDLYYGTKEYPHKLGYAQMLPVPGYLTLRKYSPFYIPRWLASKALNRMILWAGTVEDLPMPENRVDLSTSGQICLEHRFHAYDLERSRFYLEQLKNVFKKSGAMMTLGGLADQSDHHTAHQVGTTRFGKDPKTAVLDAQCRFHGYDNLFVVDGSFMPSSLGVAPALTIMANALRVADIIKKEI